MPKIPFPKNQAEMEEYMKRRDAGEITFDGTNWVTVSTSPKKEKQVSAEIEKAVKEIQKKTADITKQVKAKVTAPTIPTAPSADLPAPYISPTGQKLYNIISPRGAAERTTEANLQNKIAKGYIAVDEVTYEKAKAWSQTAYKEYETAGGKKGTGIGFSDWWDKNWKRAYGMAESAAPIPEPTPPPSEQPEDYVPPTTQPTDVDPTTGMSSDLADMIAIMRDYLEQLKERGEMINPEIEITPEKMNEFIAQAALEIDPFYAGQLKLAREGFMRSAGFSSEDLERQEANIERTYGKDVRRLGESAAERGFATSGIRQREEAELAGETQRGIEERRRQVGFQAGTAGMEFARQYGAEALPTTTIGATPQVVAGQAGFERTGQRTRFYEISPSVFEGLIGERQREQEVAKTRRVGELESAFRTQEEIKALRNITL